MARQIQVSKKSRPLLVTGVIAEACSALPANGMEVVLLMTQVLFRRKAVTRWLACLANHMKLGLREGASTSRILRFVDSLRRHGFPA